MKLLSAVFGVLFIGNSLSAQIGCSTQLKPLRPISAGSNATLLCLCLQNATGCHWEWASSTEQPRYGGVDPSIPLRVQTPQTIDIIDSAIKAQQLRNLRLQNQRMEQQLRNTPQPQELPDVSSAVIEPYIPPPNGHNWLAMKDFEKSMYLWYTINPKGKVQKQTEQALDRFYSDPANLSISIDAARGLAKIEK